MSTGQPCSECRTDDTVSVYSGPQHGLALDTEDNPVDLEVTWCTRHGLIGNRLVNTDGSTYEGI